MTRKTEHNEHCKAIADRLECIVNGELYRDNLGNEWTYYDEDDDGTITVCMYEYVMDDGEPTKRIVSAYSNDGYTWTRGDNNEEIELEQVSLYDGIGDVYNIEYRVSGRDEEPTSVELMIACGGPNIYLDTKSGNVELYWWSESGCYPMARTVVTEIDELTREFWRC